MLYHIFSLCMRSLHTCSASESTRIKMSSSSGSTKSASIRLENIKEDAPANWVPVTCPPPETPTESMEFLGRSWSLSAMELSKALSHTHVESKVSDQKSNLYCSVGGGGQTNLQPQTVAKADSPPVSPRGSDDIKELFLLHQALNPELLTNHQLLKNGLYRNIMRGRTMGRRMKDQKERRKQELRTQNAQLHAAVSVAGVASAVAALVASSATAASPKNRSTKENYSSVSKASSAIASAAALVASHCIEIAEEMGADHDQILSAVSSAINARTNGDIMTLTAGAATALRGAATLRARLQKNAASIALGDEQVEESKDLNAITALNFVSKGGELLKRTRKGDLHWKQVSFNISTKCQVVVKLKSKHMGGTFTKKKKCIVTGVHVDISAWPGREREEDDDEQQLAYFGIETSDRIIQFECRNKDEKQMWVHGIQHLLNCRAHMA